MDTSRILKEASQKILELKDLVQQATTVLNGDTQKDPLAIRLKSAENKNAVLTQRLEESDRAYLKEKKAKEEALSLVDRLTASIRKKREGSNV